ncbi:hypothetical protein SDC9_155169 [bioreactor metagenome]|uniref:Uncharacterized protein n=1 Tax=bioreactor metagenome TaxID=1076179 RepID=A0A645F123_9ZZZZ
MRFVRQFHDKAAGHNRDAFCHLDDLKARPQCIARGADCPRDHAVCASLFNHHRGEELCVLHHLLCAFLGHALFLAHLVIFRNIGREVRIFLRIDKRNAVERNVEFLGCCQNFIRVPEQRYFGNSFCFDQCNRLYGAFFRAFRQENMLLVHLGFYLDRIHQSHLRICASIIDSFMQIEIEHFLFVSTIFLTFCSQPLEYTTIISKMVYLSYENIEHFSGENKHARRGNHRGIQPAA